MEQCVGAEEEEQLSGVVDRSEQAFRFGWRSPRVVWPPPDYRSPENVTERSEFNDVPTSLAAWTDSSKSLSSRCLGVL